MPFHFMPTSHFVSEVTSRRDMHAISTTRERLVDFWNSQTERNAISKFAG